VAAGFTVNMTALETELPLVVPSPVKPATSVNTPARLVLSCNAAMPLTADTGASAFGLPVIETVPFGTVFPSADATFTVMPTVSPAVTVVALSCSCVVVATTAGAGAFTSHCRSCDADALAALLPSYFALNPYVPAEGAVIETAATPPFNEAEPIGVEPRKN
jgi:hypothetical protein